MNANVPVNISAGDITGGSNSANQFAVNGALSGAGNNSDTTQTGGQTQSSHLIGLPVDPPVRADRDP